MPKARPWILLALLVALPLEGAEPLGRVLVRVTHDGSPLPEARVVAGDRAAVTGAAGDVVLELPAGPARVEVAFGTLQAETADVVVRAGETIQVLVELHEPVELEEEIIVTATRSGRRLQ
ncbi:MAG TPA: carboxypeptidase-like regulatory domain-containing protein, partial [Vicinamibacteria bacterium]|nr:carboxypeptidase-like regulatory domain-containing protein [Vicinamibacteria bacterium]